MTKRTKYGVNSLALGLLVILLSLGACGTGEAVRIVINGQILEGRINQVDCFPLTDAYVNAASPIECVIRFQTRGYFSDIIRFTIFDARVIFEDFMGQWLPFQGGSLVAARMTFDGREVPVLGGSIRFREISNIPGGRVCADFEMVAGTLGGGITEGNFCGRVEGRF